MSVAHHYRAVQFGLIALLLVYELPLHGEVLDAAENGFTLRHSTTIAAARSEVYSTAVNDIARWWNSDHTISGDAENLYIDANHRGCFCEKLGDRSGIVHLAIDFVNPDVILRFTGGLGPLGLMGVSGSMTWEFEDEALEDGTTGTTVTLQYAVGGYLAGGLDAISQGVDGVLVEQMENLKRLVETGTNQNGS